MRKVAILLMLLLGTIGCTKVIVKDSVPGDEKQKAVAWIANNNVWGPEQKAGGVADVTGKYIDAAVAAGSNKNAGTVGSNIYIAYNNKMMKSGKYMMLLWKDNTFSVREMTEKEAAEMKIPDFGLKKGDL
jgi:uncharacterized protein YceK